MKDNIFLRVLGLNCDFKLKGGSYDGTLLELLRLYDKNKSKVKKLTIHDVSKSAFINLNIKIL